MRLALRNCVSRYTGSWDRYLLPILWHVNCLPLVMLSTFALLHLGMPSWTRDFHDSTLWNDRWNRGPVFVDRANKTISLAVHDPWRQPEIIVCAFHRDLPFRDHPLLSGVVGILGQIPWLKRRGWPAWLRPRHSLFFIQGSLEDRYNLRDLWISRWKDFERSVALFISFFFFNYDKFG